MLSYTLMRYGTIYFLTCRSRRYWRASPLYSTVQNRPTQWLLYVHSPLEYTARYWCSKNTWTKTNAANRSISTGNSRFQDNVNKRAVKRIRKRRMHAWYSKNFADCISGPPTLSAGRPLLDYSLIACGAVHVLVPNIRNGTGPRGILELKIRRS